MSKLPSSKFAHVNFQEFKENKYLVIVLLEKLFPLSGTHPCFQAGDFEYLWSMMACNVTD